MFSANRVTAMLAVATLTAAAASPALAAPPTWSGMYVGAYAAMGFAQLDLSAQGESLDGIGGKGPAAGGIIGYNARLAERIVGGIELSGGWADFNSHIGFTSPGQIFVDSSANSNWNASIMARFGILASPTTLFYLAAGGTIGGGEYSVYADDTVSTVYADESHRPGLYGFAYVGVGAETQLMANWRLRYEYVYNYLAPIDIPEAGIGLSVRPLGGIGKVALIYAFEQPGAPANFGYAPPRWTDFYVGGVAGHAMALSKFEGAGYDINGVGSAGFLSGLLAGAEMQIGPSFVAGVEGEYSWTNVGVNFTGPSGGADSFWAVRGRLGYLATPGPLIYGAGGVARIRLPNVDSSGYHDGNAVEFGGGIETFLMPGLSLRAEYLYTVMEKNSVSQFDVGERTTGGAARLALTGHFGG